MSATTVVVGEAVLKIGTEDAAWGLGKTQTVDHEGEKEDIKNGDGDTVAKSFTDRKKKVVGEFTPLASATAITSSTNLVGAVMTLAETATTSNTVVLESASWKYEQGKAATISLTGYQHPNLNTSSTMTFSAGRAARSAPEKDVTSGGTVLSADKPAKEAKK